jgi:hypothetical protein
VENKTDSESKMMPTVKNYRSSLREIEKRQCSGGRKNRPMVSCSLGDLHEREKKKVRPKIFLNNSGDFLDVYGSSAVKFSIEHCPMGLFVLEVCAAGEQALELKKSVFTTHSPFFCLSLC